VVFTSSGKTPLIACPYTLVTDDGEFLVLIGDFFGPAALSIYRRRIIPGFLLGALVQITVYSFGRYHFSIYGHQSTFQ
jgi:hypothetical protein